MWVHPLVPRGHFFPPSSPWMRLLAACTSNLRAVLCVPHTRPCHRTPFRMPGPKPCSKRTFSQGISSLIQTAFNKTGSDVTRDRSEAQAEEMSGRCLQLIIYKTFRSRRFRRSLLKFKSFFKTVFLCYYILN